MGKKESRKAPGKEQTTSFDGNSFILFSVSFRSIQMSSFSSYIPASQQNIASFNLEFRNLFSGNFYVITWKSFNGRVYHLIV